MDGANAGEGEVSMQEGSAEAEARRIQPGGTSHRFRSCAARRPTDRLVEDSLMSLEMFWRASWFLGWQSGVCINTCKAQERCRLPRPAYDAPYIQQSLLLAAT